MPKVRVPLDKYLNKTLDALQFPNCCHVTNSDENKIFVVTLSFMYMREATYALYHTVFSQPAESEAEALWDASKQAMDYLKANHQVIYHDYSYKQILSLYDNACEISKLQVLQEY
ncbi:hypothetical protein M5689_020732 [Euphorbia peplus]|nr:hypothetical protein M5689_020732 [Euphorbia peplus]